MLNNVYFCSGVVYRIPIEVVVDDKVVKNGIYTRVLVAWR